MSSYYIYLNTADGCKYFCLYGPFGHANEAIEELKTKSQAIPEKDKQSLKVLLRELDRKTNKMHNICWFVCDNGNIKREKIEEENILTVD